MKLTKGKNKNCKKLQEINLKEEEVKDIRILKRNLVYVKGMPKFLAFQDLLIRPEFLGQYGNITHIFIKKEKPQKNKLDTFGVHVTYSNPAEASLAILCLNGCKIDNYKLKAAFGMTKFCQFYLRNKKCPKKNCTYIHYSAKLQDITSISNKKINRYIRSVNEINTIKYILHNKFNFDNSCVVHPMFPHMKVGLQKIEDFQNQNSSKQHKIKLGKIFLIDDQKKDIASFINYLPQSQQKKYSYSNYDPSEFQQRQNCQFIDICQQIQYESKNQLYNSSQIKNDKLKNQQLSDYQNQYFQKTKFANSYYGSSTEDDSIYNKRFENIQNDFQNFYVDKLQIDKQNVQENFNTFWNFPYYQSQS